MGIFVSMNDSFMSGWGNATGKTNTYSVECDTTAQMEQIAAHARTRPEMKYIRVSQRAPRNSTTRIVTFKHYLDLGGCWIEDGGRL